MRRIVIFDIDWTLMELQQAESDAYVQAFSVSYGIEGVSDDWSSYHSRSDVGVASEILARHFARPCENYELETVLRTYNLLLRRDVFGKGIKPKLVPGAKPLLQVLTKQEVGLALATGNLEQIAKLRLQRAGIWKYFPCGGFGEDGDSKTAILEKAISRCTKLWPDTKRLEDIVYVGDQATDETAAIENGVGFIGINGYTRQLDSSQGPVHPHYLRLDLFLRDLNKMWYQETEE